MRIRFTNRTAFAFKDLSLHLYLNAWRNDRSTWLLEQSRGGGRPDRGMPEFGTLLGEAPRWHVINSLRAFGTTTDQRRVGAVVELNDAWLIAPD